MMEWLSIPRLIDFILLAIALEALWLVHQHRRREGAGIPPTILHILSGALLLIAMRSALADSSPLLTAVVLGLAGIFHFLDVRKELFPER